MTAAIRLMAEAVPDDQVPALPEPPADGLCCLTGEHGPTIDRRHILTDSFTGWDLLAAPDSDRIGVHVWRAWFFGWREPGKRRDNRPERMSSWQVTESGITLLDRQGVRAAVLGVPPAGRWAGYATTSYKKHGTLLAPVNGPGRAAWLFETTVVDCSDRARLADLWAALRGWQDKGVARPVLESAAPAPHLLAKLGMVDAMALEAFLAGEHGTPLYTFLCYLLPSQEELKTTKGGDDHGPSPLARKGR